MHSYGTRKSRTNKTTVDINFILVGLFGIHLLSHADIYQIYRGNFTFAL